VHVVELEHGGPVGTLDAHATSRGAQQRDDRLGVNVESFTPLDAGGPLTIQAITQGAVQVGLVFSSSGSVTANDLVVLTDDQQLQTAENILPAVHTAALIEEITAALDSVSAVLTTDELQALNQQVEIDRKDPSDVATEFLTSKGLLS
jgi:osmoprotectant transport system substrate-binding protein